MDQLDSIKAKQVKVMNEKEETQMRQQGKLAFARLKVELSIEEVDFNAQIKDCTHKINKLKRRQDA